MIWEQWDKIVVSRVELDELVSMYKSKGFYSLVLYKGFIRIEDPLCAHYLVFNLDQETHSGSFSCWIDHKGKKYKYFDGYFYSQEEQCIQGEYIPGVIEIPIAGSELEKKEALLGSINLGFSIIMLYMEYGVEVIEKSVENITVTGSKSRKSKTKKQRKPRVLKRVVYDIKLTKESMGRVMERHTESWTVRGHWRSLPGGVGKTWVRSYVKGDKSKFEPSTYDLESI